MKKFTISHEFPDNIADALRQHWPTIARAHLESLAVISYRAGILTSYQVRLILDHDSRWETEEFLHKHQCYLHYDEEDFRRDGEVMKKIPINQ